MAEIKAPVPVPPSSTTIEAVATAAKIAVSAIPVIGGALAESINAGVGAVVQRRRDEFLSSLAAKVSELAEEHVLDADHLSENPVFVDAIVQTAQAAMRTSIEEKRVALRNALLNSIMPSARMRTFVRYSSGISMNSRLLI